MKLLLIYFLCISTLHAQGISKSKYGPGSQFRFSVTPALYSNIKFESAEAAYMKSPLGIGGEMTIAFSQKIWNGFGINAGVGYGLVPYNFTFDAVVEPGSPLEEIPEDIRSSYLGSFPNRDMNSVFIFPIMLEKVFVLNQEERLYLDIEAGIKWNEKTSFPFSSSGSYTHITEAGEEITYFEYEITSADQKSFLSYVFKAGLVQNNNRQNSFKWNLVFQYSPSRMITGNYQFHDMNNESFGTMEQRNSFIGIEFIYGLSLHWD